MIVIVDYGMGNLGSIQNMLKKIGARVAVSSEIQVIEEADKLILPGVGAFDNGMRKLREHGFIDVLVRKVCAERTPILGICLGMQLFSKSSEEGAMAGLGWIDAETVRFRFDGPNAGLKVPHMGWNTIQVAKESRLLDVMYDDPRFYFIHSYHVACRDREDVLTTTNYGIEFVSAVARENIMGVQFHPEKSHKFGMRLLQKFAEMT